MMGLIADYQTDCYAVRCAHCRAPMAIDRIVPRYGVLPEFRRYKCHSCGSMKEFELSLSETGIGLD
jgi:transposase-like protein